MDGLQFMEGRIPALSPADEVAAALAAGRSVAVVGPGESQPFLALVGEALRARGARVLPAGPPLHLPALLEQIAATAPMPEQAAVERGYELLTEPDPAGGRTVLLVRDAHLLPEQTLRYLDMALRTCPQLQLVLAGQAALADLLALPGFTTLGRHLAVRVALPGPDLAAPCEPEPPAAPPTLPGPATRVEPLLRPPAAAPASAVVPVPAVVPVRAAVPVRTRRSWRPLALAGALAAGVAGLTVMARAPTPPVLPAPAVADAAPAPVASAPVAAPVPAVAVAPAVPSEAETSVPSLPEPPAAPATGPVAVATAPVAPEPPGLPEPPSAAPVPVMAVAPAVPPLAAEASAPEPPAAAPAGPVAVATAPAAPEPAAIPEPASAVPTSVLAGPAKLPVRTVSAAPPRISAPPRAERAAAPAAPPNDRRCRSIVQRAQLGDALDHDDLQFLRNGCR